MEILSPASNMEHIRVAIDNKADAVYGGLEKWNARNKAINFTTEEYNLLIDELHEHNIKFFLTLNILMLDEEIDEVIDFLKNNKLPDSFIVADIGLIERLKKEFPTVPLHFSTQFGCHSIDDVNYVEALGGDRAILARELDLQEIENIKDNTNIELECFVWGSQCLSFSGLCFFGTLINGGGGNRGKCIITCRDIYSINDNKGHYLYVPDMDCINLLSKLDGIDCLKLEGRRRNPNEIKDILNRIHSKVKSERNVGYLFGTQITQNNLFEKINTRTKPVMKASELDGINENDICLKYNNSIPIEFSTDYEDPNVMYIYTELKKDYDINKKNLMIDFILDDSDNHINEALYVNHNGDGHTFFGDSQNLMEFDFDKFVNSIEEKNNKINIYKIKYKRTNNKKLMINKEIYKDMVNYILNDCKNKEFFDICNNHIRLDSIYLETDDIKVIDEFINDKFVKIIYNISTINNLENIKNIIEKYDNKIIYKLPLFNWKSKNLDSYVKLLEGKEVMFTRPVQAFLYKDFEFKKRYIDYTVYIWNKSALKYYKNLKIDEFTASPELSYKINDSIFKNNPFQVIICGKLPLVYTRNCFKHLYGCLDCKNNQKNCKNINNVDKNLNFEIFCNDDYRYILNKEPFLNDYSKVEINKATKFRYVTLGQDLTIIRNTIEKLKKENYYEELKKETFWENSYECNLLESKN